jgi:hypothetical protein
LALAEVPRQRVRELIDLRGIHRTAEITGYRAVGCAGMTVQARQCRGHL